jgi:hypothetical protein
VQIAILIAMAKCFASDKEAMFVLAFSSRPLLHVKPKDLGTRQMAVTFAMQSQDMGNSSGKVTLGRPIGELEPPSEDSYNKILLSCTTPVLQKTQLGQGPLDPVCGLPLGGRRQKGKCPIPKHKGLCKPRKKGQSDKNKDELSSGMERKERRRAGVREKEKVRRLRKMKNMHFLMILHI